MSLMYLYSALYDLCDLIMCTTGLLDAHTGHFCYLNNLTALDLLTCPGSPSYLGLHLHGHAPPLAHLLLHQFWHA